MTRLTALNPADATGRTKELFNGVQAKLGVVPNMMRTMAQSPAVLEAYLGFNGALTHTLDAKERELIALAVAEVNGCDYCASVHSTLGKMVGLNAESILQARQGTAANARQRAVIELAVAIARHRGSISDAQLVAAKDAGLSEAAIAEVVANVAINVLTNFFNNVAQTELDFPRAEKLEPAVACNC